MALPLIVFSSSAYVLRRGYLFQYAGWGYLARHELTLRQLREVPSRLDKLIELAAFDDASVLKHQNAIGVAHGGEPVRDHEGGASLHHFRERAVHLRFGERVKVARCLVKNE